jgi:hypothetical protein
MNDPVAANGARVIRIIGRFAVDLRKSILTPPPMELGGVR